MKNINKLKQYRKENKCTHMCTVGTKGKSDIVAFT